MPRAAPRTPLRSIQPPSPLNRSTPSKSPFNHMLEKPVAVSLNATPTEISDMYEQWMKLAADNKINANNSWNLGLIDYFHEMNILRDGDSINFQKASCTLDGCVKIYTSRVDSVASETEKLVSGLAEQKSSKRRDDNDDEENDGDEEELKKPKKRGPAKTLVSDFSSITLKKFDLEFSVDPLFRKTCADFDEGGAKGLLLNHLNVYGEGRIIFDASDALTDEYDQYEHEVEPNERIDISKLKYKFCNALSDMWNRQICPSMKDFKFSKPDASLEAILSQINLAEDDDIPLAPAAESSNGTSGKVDYIDFDLPNEDYGMDYPDYGDDGDDYDGGAPGSDDNAEEGPTAAMPTDRDLVHALVKNVDDDTTSYFEETVMKNWAGPDYWRRRRIIPAPSKTTEPEQKRVRKERIPFSIDFVGNDNVDIKALFAPGGSTINLPKNTEKPSHKHLLPEDVRFSGKDLTTLFMKPKFTFRPVRSGGRQENTGFQSESADYAMDGYDDDYDDPGMDFGMPDDQIDSSNLAAEQTFNQTGEHASQYYLDADPEESLLGDYDSSDAIYPTIKKTNKITINYARTAKKVDVKRLKDNIWRELVDMRPAPTATPRPPPPSAKVPKEQKFSEILSGLSDVYPTDNIKDISVPFCFICLLHLANEKGLRIENRGMEELVITQ
ncbi:condensin complex subunit 2/barren [Paraphysoderma sedebokerense]|nr:condensin complex subunit 2/barren [Paraphysoderma sedebokerense]